MNNRVNCDDYNILSEIYNEAIIGQSTNGNIIYDYDKVVECASKYFNMNIIDANEYINKNVEPTLIYYSEPPIIMYNINKYDLLL
jgi:hypothetical protein